ACWERATTSPRGSPLVHERFPTPGAVVSPVSEGSQNPAGFSASQTPDAPVYLTRAELDVLRLLAKGQRNKDIARELYVSVNTVKSHVASIFRKLRVKNRSQAVRYVYSRGVR
ncbi:MAG: response regulator transcription factor, partial [Bacillota bacterium]